MKVLTRRWIAILTTVIATAALGLLVTLQLTPSFQASAKIFLNTSGPGSRWWRWLGGPGAGRADPRRTRLVR
jgi:capsular polysaccharide biosynthesis protein